MSCASNDSTLDAWAKSIEFAALQGLPQEAFYAAIPKDCLPEVLSRIPVVVPPPTPPQLSSRSRKEWLEPEKTAQGALWSALRNFQFATLNRSRNEIASLDAASDAVLSLLGNPNEVQKDDKTALPQVKGLVVGYVQSGKTANYSALIAKAFDAGYTNVIVLTGIHNSLRRQTQIRLNNELGLVPSSESRPTARPANALASAILPMTSEELTNGDFKYSNIPSQVLANNKTLFVSKKNVNVLQSLIDWLDGSFDKNIPIPYPTLIIDDEADQATINTNAGSKARVDDVTYFDSDGLQEAEKSDLDPTRINALIRTLVNRFGNVSYVGYTATPYANVFIKANDTHEILQDDLYPKDFIVSLVKPEGYMGPEEFFGTAITGVEDSGLPFFVKIVPQTETKVIESLPPRSYIDKTELPSTLQAAVRHFVLVSAARRAFEGRLVPTSMLVHASHLNERQSALKSHLETYVDMLAEEWRYSRDEAKISWERDWLGVVAEMTDGTYKLPFGELESHIAKLLSKTSRLEVILLNYSSTDELDYERDPNLTAIVVGGNRLSRGLTLEGLLVSYFIRSASVPKADSLTQMGRFFGYRKNVIDLTRLYTTAELRDAFIDVSLVEESLRRELEEFASEGKLPKDFAVRVARRRSLMPTAANKMKSAVVGGTSYSGDLVQTTSFPNIKELTSRKQNAEPKLLANLETAKKFVQGLIEEIGQPAPATGRTISLKSNQNANQVKWSGVSSSKIIDFLKGYHSVDGATRFVSGSIRQYVEDLSSPNGHGECELTSWTVVIAGRAPKEELGIETFGTNLSFGRIERSLVKDSESSIGVLVSPIDIVSGTGDELFDLTAEEIKSIRLKKADDNKLKVAAEVRATRSKTKGLMVLYPISPESKADGESNAVVGKSRSSTLGQALFGIGEPSHTVVGVAISFPVSAKERNSFLSQVIGGANGQA